MHLRAQVKLAALTLAIATFLAATTWAAAPRGGATTRPQGGRIARGGATVPADLHRAMEAIDRTYRAIKADAADATRQEQTLRNIDTLVRDAAISKMFVPESVSRMPAEKRAEATASYRAMMTGLIKSLFDLEEAVVAKKPDEIKKSLEQLDELQKAGHAEFAPDVK